VYAALVEAAVIETASRVVQLAFNEFLLSASARLALRAYGGNAAIPEALIC